MCPIKGKCFQNCKTRDFVILLFSVVLCTEEHSASFWTQITELTLMTCTTLLLGSSHTTASELLRSRQASTKGCAHPIKLKPRANSKQPNGSKSKSCAKFPQNISHELSMYMMCTELQQCYGMALMGRKSNIWNGEFIVFPLLNISLGLVECTSLCVPSSQ